MSGPYQVWFNHPIEKLVPLVLIWMSAVSLIWFNECVCIEFKNSNQSAMTSSLMMDGVRVAAGKWPRISNQHQQNLHSRAWQRISMDVGEEEPRISISVQHPPPPPPPFPLLPFPPILINDEMDRIKDKGREFWSTCGCGGDGSKQIKTRRKGEREKEKERERERKREREREWDGDGGRRIPIEGRGASTESLMADGIFAGWQRIALGCRSCR